MLNVAVIARPYAKALFHCALSQQQFDFWSKALQILTLVVLEPQVKRFIENPHSTTMQHVDLLLSLLLSLHPPNDDMQTCLTQWVKVLVMARRVMILPEVLRQFQIMRDTYEKTLVITIRSFMPLTPVQHQAMQKQLSKKFNRQVTLNIIQDEALIGGAMIMAGDDVIDGSVRGQLQVMRMRLMGE